MIIPAPTCPGKFQVVSSHEFTCVRSSHYGNLMSAPKVTELYLLLSPPLSFHLLLISLQERSKKTKRVLSFLHLESPQERLSLKLVTWNFCFILWATLLVMHIFYDFCHHIGEWMCTIFFKLQFRNEANHMVFLHSSLKTSNLNRMITQFMLKIVFLHYEIPTYKCIKWHVFYAVI